MKSQDILLLLKIITLYNKELGYPSFLKGKWDSWALLEAEILDDDTKLGGGVDDIEDEIFHLGSTFYEEIIQDQYSMRRLAESTGISKTQVNISLHRSYESGLAKPDRKTGWPRVNQAALTEFIAYGLKYVFPVKPAEVTRGIPTGWAAPILSEKIMSTGDLIQVWPYARGASKGVAITPLYKTAPQAIYRDPQLYALLALTDAIRVGQQREKTLAIDLLNKFLNT